MKTGITDLLRSLEVGDSKLTRLRTSEVYIIAKRIGIKIKKEKVGIAYQITRLK